MGPKKVGQRSRFNLGWHPFREFSHFLKIFFNRNLQLRVFPVIFLSSVAGVRDLTVTEIDLVSTLPRSPPLFSAYFYAFASVSRSSHNGEGNYARAWKIFRVSKRRRRWVWQIEAAFTSSWFGVEFLSLLSRKKISGLPFFCKVKNPKILSEMIRKEKNPSPCFDRNHAPCSLIARSANACLVLIFVFGPSQVEARGIFWGCLDWKGPLGILGYYFFKVAWIFWSEMFCTGTVVF